MNKSIAIVALFTFTVAGVLGLVTRPHHIELRQEKVVTPTTLPLLAGD